MYVEISYFQFKVYLINLYNQNSSQKKKKKRSIRHCIFLQLLNVFAMSYVFSGQKHQNINTLNRITYNQWLCKTSEIMKCLWIFKLKRLLLFWWILFRNRNFDNAVWIFLFNNVHFRLFFFGNFLLFCNVTTSAYKFWQSHKRKSGQKSGGTQNFALLY